MNELKHTNNKSLFRAHKQDPASLTQNDIADIVRWSETHNLSRSDAAKLILLCQARKKAAYLKKRKQSS